MRSKLKARNAASADAAGSVMPTRPVRSTASSTAAMNAPICAERVAADDRRRPSSGRSSGVEDPGAHRVLEVVADVRDAVGPRDDLAFGRRRCRPPPRVVAHTVERLAAQVQLRERDVGAVDRVVVAAGQVRRERLLRRVPGRAVAAVVRERDRFGERHAEPGRARDAGRDLRDLDRMGEPGAQVVVLGGDEHLALARQPPPRPRVLDPIEVAFEAQPELVGLLGPAPVAGADADASRRARADTSSSASRHSRRCRLPPTYAPACACRTTTSGDRLGDVAARSVTVGGTVSLTNRG